ncbi:MAG TPA: M67 family metallopeptidase [Ktedonobacterales bacterium]|jgi:proteasome lid subunit RPN8/RPN11
MAKVILSTQARQTIRADMLQRPRIEACGLLVGEITPAGDWIADDALPLRNTRNSSVRFEFDSLELLEYDMAYGERIVGVYHSHPGGPPYPSGIDTGNMENLQDSPWVWLIASFSGRRSSARDDSEADELSIAAYRHDPQSGLQTIPIFIPAALQRESAQNADAPGDQ